MKTGKRNGWILAAALFLVCIFLGRGMSSRTGASEPAPKKPALPASEESVPHDPEESVLPASEEIAPPVSEEAVSQEAAPQAAVIDISHIPEYFGTPYVVVNGNVPEFSDADRTEDSFETYSELDALGRCGAAYANIGTDLMPTQERGSIGQVKPTGWHLVRYDILDDIYLYNRCHLIGYQLTGENSNEKNLITGTRYLNVEGMLPFENAVADYIRETGNHVLYRVTPIFEGDDLLVRGVQMEAESVEDDGAGISFNVYCYNVQPGIRIDYATGDSGLVEGIPAETSAPGPEPASGAVTYILNTNTHKFHEPSCSGAADISERNRQEFTGTREEAIGMGYSPCGICRP